MTGKRRCAELFGIGVAGSLIPCLAMAVNMPAGPFLEQVNTAALDAGQLDSPAAIRPGWTIQVGAFSERDAAEAQIARIASLSSGEFSHAASAIAPMPWHDRKMLYRARFVGLVENQARASCVKLLDLNIPCIVMADQPGDQAGGGTGTTSAPAADKDQPAAPGAADAIATELTAISPTLRGVEDQGSPEAAPDATSLNAPNGTLLATADAVSNHDLAKMRGGFFTAAGAQFDFGASVRTMVNGQLALLSTLNWTPAGPQVQQLAGLGQSIQALVASDLAKAGINTPSVSNTSKPDSAPTSSLPQVNSVAPSASPLQIGNAAQPDNSNPITNAVPAGNTVQTANATPLTTLVSNVVPTGLKSSPIASDPPPASGSGGNPAPNAAPQVLNGVQILSPTGGATQVLANLNAGQIQNIVLNTASNQTITQNTNVMLTIYNFQDWQKQLSQNLLTNQLINEMLAAAGLGGGH
jgi:hypothetical protein